MKGVLCWVYGMAECEHDSMHEEIRSQSGCH